MNESETNFPANASITEQLGALQRLVFILLLALIVVSGTLTVYLYRQASITRRDLVAIKPQATQVINVFNQNRVNVQGFVDQLRAYGVTHPDFAQQVLKKYNISPTAPAVKK